MLALQAIGVSERVSNTYGIDKYREGIGSIACGLFLFINDAWRALLLSCIRQKLGMRSRYDQVMPNTFTKILVY